MPLLDELRGLPQASELRRRLDEADLGVLAAEMEVVDRPAGAVLFAAGDPGDRLYLVLSGRVVLEAAGTPQRLPREERAAGELVGAVALSSGIAWRRTARCAGDCRLATLTRDRFNALLDRSPETWRRLESVTLERMRRERLAQHLDRLFGPFGPLLPHVLREVEDHSEWLTLGSGETLYAAGEEADGAYVLLAGRLRVAVATPDGEKIVSTVLAGETIGEVALLTHRPRAHTVYAARDSELVKLSRHMFELMLQRSSRAMYKVAGILVNRLVHRRSEQETERRPVRTIGVVAASAAAPLDELVAALARHLAAHGETRRLSSDAVAAELGLVGVAQADAAEPVSLRLTDWLQQQEERHRYLVYQADREWTRWSERCARQADRLVVVADATAEPDLAAAAGRLGGGRRAWSLVLLHPAGTDRPRGTARWLGTVDAGPESVYHVRAGHEDDLARLARFLSGRATGLVLGGGGARGFAHLGVLRALEQVGVAIDLVGGTSIGSTVAAWIAQGLSAEEIERRARVAFHKLIDWTFPAVSLLDGGRITRSIEREAGDWDIEDFWLPFFCVSTNLTTSRPVVHQRGNAARAIRSSVSIPGILPPVAEGEDLLVDGGVVDNLPIEVMRDLNPFGRVIAVDLNAPSGPSAKIDHGLSVSGWRHLYDRLSPFRRAQRLPALGATIMQSMMVGSSAVRERALAANLADLYLNIHVRGVGLLQFDAVDKAARVGYEESIGPLRAWREELDRGEPKP